MIHRLRRSPLSPSAPLGLLLDFAVAPCADNPCCFVYTHAATGFSFRMGPAPPEAADDVTSPAEAADPMDTDAADANGAAAEGAAAAAGDNAGVAQNEDEEGGCCEEVQYLPLALGSAEEALPEFFKVGRRPGHCFFFRCCL